MTHRCNLKVTENHERPELRQSDVIKSIERSDASHADSRECGERLGPFDPSAFETRESLGLPDEENSIGTNDF